MDEEFEEDKEDDEGDVNLSEADTIRKKYRDEKKVQVKAISPRWTNIVGTWRSHLEQESDD